MKQYIDHTAYSNESDEKGNTIFDRAAFENEYDDPDYFEQQRLAYEEESETEVTI